MKSKLKEIKVSMHMYKSKFIHTGYYGSTAANIFDLICAEYSKHYKENTCDIVDSTGYKTTVSWSWYNKIFLSPTNEVIIQYMSVDDIPIDFNSIVSASVSSILHSSFKQDKDLENSYNILSRAFACNADIEDHGNSLLISKTYTVKDALLKIQPYPDISKYYDVKLSELTYLYHTTTSDGNKPSFMPKSLDGEQFDPIKSEAIRYLKDNFQKDMNTELESELAKVRNAIKEKYNNKRDDIMKSIDITDISDFNTEASATASIMAFDAYTSGYSGSLSSTYTLQP